MMNEKMKRRPVLASIAGACALSLVFTGCATTTGKGAMGGAAAGAAVGLLAKGNLGGALVGAIAGAAVGAVIGKVIAVKVENARTLDEVNADRKKKGRKVSSKPDIEIHDASFSPAEVKRGESLNLAINYEASGAAAATPPVAHYVLTNSQGAVIAENDLKPETGNGFPAGGTVSQPLKIPKSQQPGEYQLTLTMQNGDKVAKSVVPFRVVA